MMLRIIILVSLYCVFYLALSPMSVTCCNEAVCASIVSKCLITQSCKCDLKECSCCKDCFNCLSHLYSECCSCVGMCPKSNHTTANISKMSHVEDLPDPIPTLFQSLVSEADSLDRWMPLTFPLDLNMNAFKPEIKKDPALLIQTNEQEIDPNKDIITLNCSVAYLSSCMPWNKCKASCQSMGANSYRWFHNGCCECVGEKCINYGINESRCSQCGATEVVQPNVELDFGEEDEVVD